MAGRDSGTWWMLELERRRYRKSHRESCMIGHSVLVGEFCLVQGLVFTNRPVSGIVSEVLRNHFLVQQYHFQNIINAVQIDHITDNFTHSFINITCSLAGSLISLIATRRMSSLMLGVVSRMARQEIPYSRSLGILYRLREIRFSQDYGSFPCLLSLHIPRVLCTAYRRKPNCQIPIINMFGEAWNETVRTSTLHAWSETIKIASSGRNVHRDSHSGVFGIHTSVAIPALLQRFHRHAWHRWKRLFRATLQE